MNPEIKLGRPENSLDLEIEKRQPRLTLFEPDFCRQKPVQATQIMLQILAENYGTHNLSNNPEALAKDIREGKIMPFIAFDKSHQPVSCAALISLSETEVEIGRGACLPGKNGGSGLPMLVAFKRWQEEEIFPESKVLRAEVRTAMPTRNVPGGQATQIICLKKLGLQPTAIVPMFHHGKPDQQELFFLASRFKNQNIRLSPAPVLPHRDLIEKNNAEGEIFQQFWTNFWNQPLVTGNPIVEKDLPWNQGLDFRVEGPVLSITPSVGNVSICERSVSTFMNEGGRFALAKIPLSLGPPAVNKIVNRLKSSGGFRLCGFEPFIDQKGQLEINLLLGKLSSEGAEKLVMPAFPPGLFPVKTEVALLETFINWRRQACSFTS